MKKILILVMALFLCGCTGAREKIDYVQITQEEAKRIMEEETGYLIVDVRTQEEYAEGHIPGAINIPNESIGNTNPSQLPDQKQKLLIYCRSGNRSKQAAEKLAALGYSNVYEFGGINTWNGEIEK